MSYAPKASNEEEIPEITIGGFNLVDQQAPVGSASTTNPGRPNPGVDSGRPDARERLASDRPGEELAQDATIWKLYLEEAAEQDQELVDGRHKSLDMLLLFAALFSAVLSAFLIESKDLLQADPAETSANLLFLIAQSQYRMEHGLPANSDSPPDLINEFIPTTLARWINGLWFTSLGLSLSAALIAMLGKEWLTTFLASRPRRPRARALVRQSQLDGLDRWWALHIIALLPSLLHLSLLLFSVGLVLYLWTIDVVSAAVLTAITGITTLFYLVTAVLGAIYDYCPFVTELSGYMHKATVALSGWDQAQPRSGSDSGSNEISQKDLQALHWLANNARDPAVVDCSYQSLAGLNGPIKTNWSDQNDLTLGLTKFDPISMPMEISPDITFCSLLKDTINRFNHPSTSPLHLNNADTTAVPRYINAILALSSRILSMPGTSFDIMDDDAIELQAQMAIDPNKLPVPLLRLLGLTDSVWSNDYWPLTATTYADILVAECNALLITSSMLGLFDESAALRQGKGSDNRSIEHHTSDDTPLHVIDMPTRKLGALLDKALRDVRARYTRWLLRVWCLLHFHSQNEITIEGRALDSLLNALGPAAQTHILNPCDAVSTHLTQADELGYATYQCSIKLGSIGTFKERRENLCFGPLTSLISLLENRPGIKEGSSVQTCLAILKAYSRLAPVLLQQVLELPNRDAITKEFDIHNWPEAHKPNMLGIRYMCTRLMLVTFGYLGSSKTKVLDHLEFCKKVISVTEPCAAEDNHIKKWNGSHRARLEHGSNLVPFLEFLDDNSSVVDRVPARIKYRLIVMSGYRYQGVVSICENQLTPRCFPVLLSLLSASGTSSYSADDMLNGIVRRIQGTNRGSFSIPWDDNPAIDYLYQFSRGSKGFSAIASAYTSTYADGVVELALNITQMAAGEYPSAPDMQAPLETQAIPGLLQVLDIVVKHYSKKRELKKLSQFIAAALTLLSRACGNPDSRRLISESSTCQTLWDALVTLGNEDSSRSLTSRMRELASRAGLVLSGAMIAHDNDSSKYHMEKGYAPQYDVV